VSVMGKWEIEYYDEGESGFMPFLPSEIDQVYFEHEGEPYATFYINNTTANQTLIQQDLLVNIYFDSVLQFSGILQGGDLEAKPTRILVTVVDDLFITLDKATPISGAFSERHGAKAILDVILAGTGYTSDSTVPTTVIPVVFYHANRLDCMAFLRKALNMDFWHSGTVVYFGSEGSGVTQTPAVDELTISKRALSRRKQYDKVEVRGVDGYGYHIVGVAGTGARVKVINETEVADAATLNTIAARKLAELTTDSAGLPISVPIWVGKSYALGNSVTIVAPRFLLNGTYKIKQLTKSKTKVSMQLDNFRKPLDATVDELKNWEDRGIYTPGSTSWSLNLQGLIGLYHLNEGSGTEAKNKSPINPDVPIDGTISGCSWEDGPITKMLTFNGSSAMVSLGSDSQAGINLTSKLSVGGWFSPSANDSTDRNIVHKDGQFGLKYKVSTGVLTFTLTTGSGLHTFASDAGVITVGGRLFVMCTYDGATVKMYINGYLHKQWSQTGNPSTSPNTVYLGVFLKGVLAEVMLWQRALVDQEVLELYFFPLFRVVSGGSSGSGGGVGGHTNDVVTFKVLSVGWDI
jgi:hypothetical protein